MSAHAVAKLKLLVTVMSQDGAAPLDTFVIPILPSASMAALQNKVLRRVVSMGMDAQGVQLRDEGGNILHGDDDDVVKDVTADGAKLTATLVRQAAGAVPGSPKTRTVMGGNYAVLETLGQGSFGITSKVRDVRGEGVFACKSQLYGDLKKANTGLREAMTMTSVSHPNLVACLEADVSEGESGGCVHVRMCAYHYAATQWH